MSPGSILKRFSALLPGSILANTGIMIGIRQFWIASKICQSAVGANVSIDWRMRENVCAQLRVQVKRILRQWGYPPDKQEKATQTVLKQAALLSAWAT